MEPSPTPLTVEFDHPRLRPEQLPQLAHLPGAVVMNEFTPGLKRRVGVARAVLVVLGAAALAFVTQRLGLPLSGGLCVFFGALPVLWIVGFLVGAGLTAKKTAQAVRTGAAQVNWGEALERSTVMERVTLEVGELGLRVTRRAADQPESSALVGWNRVSFTRVTPDMALLGLDPGEPVSVPARAFPEAAAFDAFCLAVQGRVWAAQRG